MIDRNCTVLHEFVCATDDATGLDQDIRTAPIDPRLVRLGVAFPKLTVFRPDAAEIFGQRLCLIDLDSVIVGSIDAIVGRPEPFVIWRDVLANSQPTRFKYNSSLILMDASARSAVWERLSPTEIKKILHHEHRCGSDQAWISHLLNGEATWTAADGVLSWRFEVKGKSLPGNAKIVFFHGPEKPWNIPNEGIVKRHWN